MRFLSVSVVCRWPMRRERARSHNLTMGNRRINLKCLSWIA
jgi:hypothetical protein